MYTSALFDPKQIGTGKKKREKRDEKSILGGLQNC